LGIQFSVLAGSSIGSLIAAAYAGGMSVQEMFERATALRKPDLFRLDHVGMLRRGMMAPSLYLGKPLERIIEAIVPAGTFADLSQTLLVNTVDLEAASQVLFGLPGLRDVSIADAVYASCALPGFFPPGVVAGRTCADGGISDNVPAQAASHGMDAVVAVDVGSTNIAQAQRIREKGFAAIYMRATQILLRSLQARQLEAWRGPPLLLVRPPVWSYPWFSFVNIPEIITAGYQSAMEIFERAGPGLLAGGIWPRNRVEVVVDRERCTGCTLCVSLAPGMMRMGSDGFAHVLSTPVEWSRAEGDFVHQCPTSAIRVRSLGPAAS
jgi:NTE family protein